MDVDYNEPVNPWYALCKSLYLPTAQSWHKTLTFQIIVPLINFQVELRPAIEVLEISTVRLLEFFSVLE